MRRILGKFDLEKRLNLTEAFGLAQASIVVEKLGKFLTRKIGQKVSVGLTPIAYQNAYGKFQGFFFSIKGMQKLFRMNFLLNKSSSIESIDFYDMQGFMPDVTIDTNGMNIIQIADLLVEELDDGDVSLEDDFSESRSFRERVDEADRQVIFDMWIAEHPGILHDLTSKPLAKVYMDKYVDWADTPRAEMPLHAFTALVKKYLFAKNLTNASFRKRKKGMKDRIIVDQAMSDQFQDVVDDMDWQEKFQMIEIYGKMICDAQVQSLILYGSPGSGKTKIVSDILEKEIGANGYHVFKGGIKGTDELVKILYTYKDNQVIVFDDCDSVFKNKDNINILKAVLQNGTPEERTVTWLNLNRLDKNPTARNPIPPKFAFDSGIIFVSNQITFDPAILSRSAVVEITLTNEQMLDRIGATMEDFHPEVPMTVKQEVLAFLKDLANGVRSIDFRTFELVLALWTAVPNPVFRKKMILMQLKSSEV